MWKPAFDTRSTRSKSPAIFEKASNESMGFRRWGFLSSIGGATGTVTSMDENMSCETVGCAIEEQVKDGSTSQGVEDESLKRQSLAYNVV